MTQNQSWTVISALALAFGVTIAGTTTVAQQPARTSATAGKSQCQGCCESGTCSGHATQAKAAAKATKAASKGCASCCPDGACCPDSACCAGCCQSKTSPQSLILLPGANMLFSYSQMNDAALCGSVVLPAPMTSMMPARSVSDDPFYMIEVRFIERTAGGKDVLMSCPRIIAPEGQLTEMSFGTDEDSCGLKVRASRCGDSNQAFLAITADKQNTETGSSGIVVRSHRLWMVQPVTLGKPVVVGMDKDSKDKNHCRLEVRVTEASAVQHRIISDCGVNCPTGNCVSAAACPCPECCPLRNGAMAACWDALAPWVLPAPNGIHGMIGIGVSAHDGPALFGVEVSGACCPPPMPRMAPPLPVGPGQIAPNPMPVGRLVSASRPMPAPCPMPIGPVMQAAVKEIDRPASAGWTIKCGSRGNKTCLEVCNGDARLTSDHLSLKIDGCDRLDLWAGKKQIELKGAHFEAVAQSVCHAGSKGQVTLQGDVRLSYHQDGQQARVLAESVVIHLADGQVEIKPLAKTNK